MEGRYINLSEPQNLMLKFLCQQEVELKGEKYLVYLKEVPSKLAVGGVVERTAIRAFIKKITSTR